MKPHICKSELWFCIPIDFGFIGIGETPNDAYNDWQELNK